MPELVVRLPRTLQLLGSFHASSPGRAEAACRGAALGSCGASASCPQASSHDPLHFLWLAATGWLGDVVAEALRFGWKERLRAGPSLGTASVQHSPQP